MVIRVEKRGIDDLETCSLECRPTVYDKLAGIQELVVATILRCT